MNELKLVSDNKKEFIVNLDNSGNAGKLNGVEFSWDVVQTKNNTFSIIKDNKSYNLEVVAVNAEDKSFKIKVDGINYLFHAMDKYDELLRSLGMDNLSTKKVSNLKAPMPGLVLEIDVKVGQEVVKGETLIILEAMKMENVIKSPTDGVIKSIMIEKSETVDKNQVILNFE